MNRRELLMSFAAALQPAPSRLVAVGDVHGDDERFMDVLLMAGLVNSNRQWTGGRAVLIQLGDVLDRGPASRRVLDLLMNLQNQARRAGGLVEMLIGNHEVMRLIGDHRYVSPGEDAEFRTKNSERKRDEYFEIYLKVLQAEGKPLERGDIALGFRQQWEASFPLGRAEMIEAYSGRGKYGQWLRKRPVAMMAGGTLLVHAGISPKYLMWDERRFAERFRRDLDLEDPDSGGFLSDQEGPFWWRGFVTAGEAEMAAHVDAVLERWSAQRIIVGHTPQRDGVQARFGGKVLLADVGLSTLYGGPRACVVIEGGRASMLIEGKSVQLP
jgi:hypothetical protein